MAAVKFLTAPPIILAIKGYTFLDTFLITGVGGTLGCFFFYYAGVWFFAKIQRFFPRKKKAKTVTKKKRFLVFLKNKVGIWGITAAIPLLSIPLCMLVAAKYFPYDKRAPLIFVLMSWIWSFILTLISDELIN